MYNSKLTDIYRSLTSKELKYLEDFLRSPFHNKNTDVIRLGDYIINQAPIYNPQKLEREVVFKNIFSTAKYDDLKLRHTMSNLLKVVEDFLSYLSYTEKAEDAKLFLLKAYRKKNLGKHFNQVHQSLSEYINQNKSNAFSFLYNEFLLEEELGKQITNENNRDKDPNLQQVSDKLDAFYIGNKLKTYGLILNQQRISNKEYDVSFINEILERVKTGKYENIPIISVYYNIIYTILDGENESYFEKLKELLSGENLNFSIDELKDIYAFVRNYCIRKLNKGGNEKFKMELFEVYEKELKIGTLLNDDQLSPWTYKNIIALALNIGKHSWAETFINDYKSFLNNEHRENNYTYNLAKLNFAKGEYKKVVSLLRNVDYTDIFLNIDSKTILLKTYYELKDMFPLTSLFDSFSAFLKRKTSIGYHKVGYSNLIVFTKRLVGYEYDMDKGKIKKLIDDIKATSQLMDKQWILEKAEKSLLK